MKAHVFTGLVQSKIGQIKEIGILKQNVTGLQLVVGENLEMRTV